jgi:hypothetical protein
MENVVNAVMRLHSVEFGTTKVEIVVALDEDRDGRRTDQGHHAAGMFLGDKGAFHVSGRQTCPDDWGVYQLRTLQFRGKIGKVLEGVIPGLAPGKTVLLAK